MSDHHDHQRPADDDERWEHLETLILELVARELGTIHTQIQQLHKGQATIMATLQDITDAVNAESTVEDSIITLLNGISQQLKDALATGADPAAIQAIVDQIDADTAKVADAVTANTTPPAP
mgnify:CR=1 FL=1